MFAPVRFLYWRVRAHVHASWLSTWFPEDLMLKLNRVGLSPLVIAAAGAIALGGLVGCGDNKPKARPGNDGGVCSGSFVSPADGAKLTVADDLTHLCAGSLHTNVSLATSQPDGTS